MVSALLILSVRDAALAAVPPFKLWGELGYDYRIEHFDEAGTLNVHSGNLRINGATFISRPYIAQVVGGIGVTLNNTDAADGGDRSGRVLTGDLSLRVFPFSRFPLRVFAVRNNNSQDDQFFRPGTEPDSEIETRSERDTTLTRLGFVQRYNDARLGNFLLGYEHTIQEQSVSQNRGEVRTSSKDKFDRLRFTYGKSFGKHSLAYEAAYDITDRDQGGDRTGAALTNTSRLFSNLRHYFTPDPTLSVENRLTYNREVQEGDLEVTTPTIEFNNVSFWRPRTERPLQVNGFVRIINRVTETERSRNESTSGFANLGFNYQFRPRWRLTGFLTASFVEVGERRETGTGQSLRVGYNSPIYNLGRFDYFFSAGTGVGNEVEEDDRLRTSTADGGHTLRRAYPLGARWGEFSVNLRQFGEVINDDAGRSVQRLRHNIDLNWSSRLARRSQQVLLGFSDARTWGGGGRLSREDSSFQLIRFQASIDQGLSRFSSLSGNVRIQAQRSEFPSQGGGPETDEGAFIPSASVDVSYRHNFVFRVPRLWFLSRLRFFSDSYFPFLDDPSGPRRRETASWENRLEYSIGLLRLRLLGIVTESNGIGQELLLFQIRRYFGNT